MKKTTVLFILLAMIAGLIVTGSAQQESAPVNPVPIVIPTDIPAYLAPTTSTDTISIGSTALGSVLVDSQGMTLYYFANDVPMGGTSACMDTCAATWPAFSPASIQVSAPLDPKDFGIIMRPDGTSQATYYGWPLYYYQADTKPGDVKGNGFLNIWYVLQPDEAVLLAHTPDLGVYLTDTSGRTLYTSTQDSVGTSACSAGCLETWLVFNAKTMTAPSLLNTADFSTIYRMDGTTQTAYQGWPLYYYSGDSRPGDTNGQGSNNMWYIVNPPGTAPTPPMMAPVDAPVPSPSDYDV